MNKSFFSYHDESKNNQCNNNSKNYYCEDEKKYNSCDYQQCNYIPICPTGVMGPTGPQGIMGL